MAVLDRNALLAALVTRLHDGTSGIKVTRRITEPTLEDMKDGPCLIVGATVEEANEGDL